MALLIPAVALGLVLTDRAAGPRDPTGESRPAAPHERASAAQAANKRIRDLLGEFNRSAAAEREGVERRLLSECAAFLDAHLQAAPPQTLSLPALYWLQLAQRRGLHEELEERIRALRSRGDLPTDLESALAGYSARLRTRTGQPAPAWHLDGADPQTGLHWRRYAGELSLLHFWASWCPPSEALARTRLARLHQEHSTHGLRLVNIGVAGNGESAVEQEAFIRKLALPGAAGFDASGQVAAVFGVEAVPYLVLVNEGGTILSAGPGWTVIDAIERLLRERASGG